MENVGSNVIHVEEIIVILLLVAATVSVTSRWFRIPYTVGLVLIGLGMTAVITESDISDFPPEIILGLLVPPLVFEAAFHLRFQDLRRDFWLILLLAVPGVIITTLLVGGMVSGGTGLEFRYALVFGALIAATDPVSVVSLFRRLGAPKRLQVLLEGESLFNDGTAIVVFSLVLAIAGVEGIDMPFLEPGHFSLVNSLAAFLMVAGGGVLVGIVLGMVVSQIIGRIDDALVETTLTTVLAFGAYLVAEEVLGVSGVLAVVAAGIVNGTVGPRGMSATTRVVVFNFWEYLAFVANSIIFLLIGLTINVQVMIENWQAIGIAILAVLIARAVSIYWLGLFSHDIPRKWNHILYWGGLRGAIALALALSLSDKVGLGDHIHRLQAMAFGVVLFTLLVQGFSMDWLVKKLKLIKRSHLQEEYERRHARFIAGRAAFDYLQRMNQQGLISEHTWQRLNPIMKKQNAILVDAVKDVIISDPTVESEELDTARREALRAQRSALTGLLRDGVISEETYSQLVGEVDMALTESNLAWPELLRSNNFSSDKVKQLMAVVIQEQDTNNAINALVKLGVSVSRLPSTGGFLSRKNVTLLIGYSEGLEEIIVKSLEKSCRQRMEFVSTPLPNSPVPLLTPKRINVGGATIFVFDVEVYDEF